MNWLACHIAVNCKWALNVFLRTAFYFSLFQVHQDAKLLTLEGQTRAVWVTQSCLPMSPRLLRTSLKCQLAWTCQMLPPAAVSSLHRRRQQLQLHVWYLFIYHNYALPFWEMPSLPFMMAYNIIKDMLNRSLKFNLVKAVTSNYAAAIKRQNKKPIKGKD